MARPLSEHASLCFSLQQHLFFPRRLSFLLCIVPQALAYVWLGPVITAVQHLVPHHMRATASASFLLINNLIGIGAGSWLLGLTSDHFSTRFGDEALRYSMLASLPLYLVAALLMALAARPLRRDWVA